MFRKGESADYLTQQKYILVRFIRTKFYELTDNNARHWHMFGSHLKPSTRSGAQINKNLRFLQKFEFSVQLSQLEYGSRSETCKTTVTSMNVLPRSIRTLPHFSYKSPLLKFVEGSRIVNAILLPKTPLGHVSMCVYGLTERDVLFQAVNILHLGQQGFTKK
uniref:Uncharacterized protein n=1 Tax=Romanomermis culicivorax TaxID=13658 RepID=A0A915IKV9_ROMCU